MLKFEVPQDAVFYAILNETFIFGEDILTLEKTSKVDTKDSTFAWVVKAFGYAGALKTIKQLRKEQDNQSRLVIPNDYHLRLIYQMLCKFSESHNEEVQDSGVQEIDGFALSKIKFNALVELYFGDIDSLHMKLPASGKLKADDLIMQEADLESEFLTLGDKFYVEGATYPQLDDDVSLMAPINDFEDALVEEEDAVADFYADEDDYDDPLADYGMGDDEDNWGYED